MLKQLCRGVLIKLPVAILIEINWQGHWTALATVDGKRGKKDGGEAKGRERTQKTTTTVTTTSKTTPKLQHIHSTSTYLVSPVIDRTINMLSQTNCNSDNIVICDPCARVCVTVYQIRSLFVRVGVHMRV